MSLLGPPCPWNGCSGLSLHCSLNAPQTASLVLLSGFCSLYELECGCLFRLGCVYMLLSPNRGHKKAKMFSEERAIPFNRSRRRFPKTLAIRSYSYSLSFYIVMRPLTMFSYVIFDPFSEGPTLESDQPNNLCTSSFPFPSERKSQFCTEVSLIAPDEAKAGLIKPFSTSLFSK